MHPPRSRSGPRSGPRFTPVAVTARHNGWTPARQFEFIRVLALSQSVTRACAAVGMSRESAYKLKQRAAGGGFAIAWGRVLMPQFAKRAEREASQLDSNARGTVNQPRQDRQLRNSLARLRAVRPNP